MVLSYLETRVQVSMRELLRDVCGEVQAPDWSEAAAFNLNKDEIYHWFICQ